MTLVLYVLILQILYGRTPQVLVPHFEEFRVTEDFKGKPVAVVFTRPEERRFRTVIRFGAAEGPNFAGHYTIVEWGCGTECFQAVLVDGKIGKIYRLPTATHKDAVYYFESSWLHFQKDSNLLVVCANCRKWAREDCEQKYFVWSGDQFREISRLPRRDGHSH
jgi:hypothetical protein